MDGCFGESRRRSANVMLCRVVVAMAVANMLKSRKNNEHHHLNLHDFTCKFHQTIIIETHNRQPRTTQARRRIQETRIFFPMQTSAASTILRKLIIVIIVIIISIIWFETQSDVKRFQFSIALSISRASDWSPARSLVWLIVIVSSGLCEKQTKNDMMMMNESCWWWRSNNWPG